MKAKRAKRVDGVPPLESDKARDLWFWSWTVDGRTVDFSNKPHPLLPHRCDFHDWYSSEPCGAPHDAEAAAWVAGGMRREQHRPGVRSARDRQYSIAAGSRRLAGRS